MSETNVIVEGRSLSKEFNGNVVLRDVSIRCEAGKAIALVGENGAGKSTLMNILTGSLTPTSGTVLVDGKEVITRRRLSVRVNAGWIFWKSFMDAF